MNNTQLHVKRRTPKPQKHEQTTTQGNSVIGGPTCMRKHETSIVWDAPNTAIMQTQYSIQSCHALRTSRISDER